MTGLPAGVQVLSRNLIAQVTDGARHSPRRRLNHNFHQSMEDNAHRFLNVLLRGSYIRPHRHLNPPKSEAFLVLEGEAGILTFDEAGMVTGALRLTAGGEHWGVDLPPGLWHTVVALSPVAVCYEVKPGPWEAATDKEFARWAPREGEPGAADLVARLEAMF